MVLPLAYLSLGQAASAKALAIAAQLTASTITFEAATAHSKALKAAAKKVDEVVNTQVEVEDDEQNNSSDSEVLNEDVGGYTADCRTFLVY